MDQKSLQIRRSQWEQIVLEGNNASVSKKEWCRQNGISLKSFYYWQRKIRRTAAEALEESKSSAHLQVPARSSSSFVELPAPFPSQSDRGPALPQDLVPELMLQIGGCQIFVTGSIQERTLDTVMRVIRKA